MRHPNAVGDVPWIEAVLERVHAVALEATDSTVAAQEVASRTVVALAVVGSGRRVPRRRAVVRELARALRTDTVGTRREPSRRDRRPLARALQRAHPVPVPAVLADDIRAQLRSRPARRGRRERSPASSRRRLLAPALALAGLVCAAGVVTAMRRNGAEPDGSRSARARDATTPRSDASVPPLVPVSTVASGPVTTLAVEEPPVGPIPAPTLRSSVVCDGPARLRWSEHDGPGFANYLVLRRVGDDPRYPHAGTRTELRGGTRSADAVAFEDGTASPPAGARWMVVAVDANGTELARSQAVACP